ncbi:DUF4386 family protein [Cellulomonas sp. KH9]|uniref:DUF4386 family protein n=1 Tax=Cellulomonas sp. KH9 TaxID=1855324 RepID=UPI0008EB4675|nr:DUF4386 family protein [Cellulomonas sp. KH9]SFJ73888.1 protein of unknown function [Cellulomonas sp. KH9]
MSRATHARAAGALYLSTHVTSVLAVVAYDAGATTLGVLLEVALALGCLGTGVLLLLLLRPHGEARALTFALLRTLEAAVIAAGTLPMLALAWGGTGAGTEDALTDLHTAAFLVGQGLVISVNTIVLGSLLVGARVTPRALGLLGVVAGVVVLGSNLAQTLGAIPLGGVVAGVCAVPVFAFEIWWAVLLLTRGLRPRGAAGGAVAPQDHPATAPTSARR